MSRFFTALAQPQVAIPFDDVAPVRGMDGTQPIHNMPRGVGVFLYNIIPAEYGCRTREGYRVWTRNINGPEVKTLYPFTSQIADIPVNRLFAATRIGIFDVTTEGGDNPAPVVTFADQTDAAGFGQYLHFTNPNGEQILILADSKNGMYEYNPNGAIWTKYTTEITFPDATTPNDIAFITTHKGRLWLVARDSADAYYLPVGAKAGTATKFQFGSKMAKGGYLVGLWNWSLDGGDGIDDYLVALSKGGDVIIYRGSDPSLSDKWSMVGRWYIGPPPGSRDVALPIGNDVVLLSAFGLTSTTALLQGMDPTRIETNVTGNISRLVRDAVKTKSELEGWQVQTSPDQALVIVNTPRTDNERHIQFVLNLNRLSDDRSSGWGMWRDVPSKFFENFDKRTYFTTDDGRVCVMDGSLDNVDGQGNEVPVSFSLLTRFTHFDAPGLYKQIHFVRPQFISNSRVSVVSLPVYDYVIEEPFLSPSAGAALGDVWDQASWDQALWSGTLSSSALRGGKGYGRNVALFIQGEAFTRATLVNIEGTYQPWSFL